MLTNDQNQAETWYLAQLKPNAANIAKTHLERQGFQTFLPLEDSTQHRNGRFVATQRPLFQGYIFVALNTEGGLWRKVNATRGITRLVSLGAAPTPVPSEIVTTLMERCDAKGAVLPSVQLQTGDQVVLTSGPFARLAAEILSVDADRRVWVLMDIMGRQTRTAVDPARVRVVD